MIELKEKLTYLEGVRDGLKKSLIILIEDAKKDAEKLRLSLMVDYSDENLDHMLLLNAKIKELEVLLTN